MTFIILSIIYVMIQVVGIYFGYAFSLFGKENSAKARHYTKDFNSAEELNDWLKLKRDLVSADAESYLQQLQEKLSHRAVTSVERAECLERRAGKAHLLHLPGAQEAARSRATDSSTAVSAAAATFSSDSGGRFRGRPGRRACP